MKNNISDKDKKDWDEFTKSKEKLPNKDIKYRENNKVKIRSIDLHGYTLDGANKAVEDFITKSFEENVNKLIIVTGKGLHSDNEKDPYVSKDFGILKYSIPEFISNHSNLMSMINDMTDAKIEDGGKGAFYIFLKKNKITK